MSKTAKLLWVDLEMTGLDPEQDKILEIAAITTDWDLKPINTFEAVVKVDQKIIDTRMVGDFWEKNRESYTALTSQNATGQPIEKVEDEFLTFLNENFKKDYTIILAGNSIHQDRKFIDRELPKVAEKLHYRMLDVSAWKVYFEGALKKKFQKPEAHRALSDIEGSIKELKYYLGMFKK